MGIVHQICLEIGNYFVAETKRSRDEERNGYDSIVDGVDENEFIAETWRKIFPRRSEHIFDGNYFIAGKNI